MKASVLLVLLLGLAGRPAVARQNLDTTGSDLDTGAYADSDLIRLLERRAQTIETEANLGRGFILSGSLVGVFKTTKFWTIPGRFLQVINPVAPAEFGTETRALPGVGPRAWSTVAGLHPGGSEFADPMTHEGAFGLLSLSRR